MNVGGPSRPGTPGAIREPSRSPTARTREAPAEPRVLHTAVRAFGVKHTEAARCSQAVVDAIDAKRPRPEVQKLVEVAIRAELDFACDDLSTPSQRMICLQWCMDIHDDVGPLGAHTRELMAKVAEQGRNAYFLEATGVRLKTIHGSLKCGPEEGKLIQKVDLLSLLRAEGMHGRALKFGSSAAVGSPAGLLALAYEKADLDVFAMSASISGSLRDAEVARLREGRSPWPFPRLLACLESAIEGAAKHAEEAISILKSRQVQQDILWILDDREFPRDLADSSLRSALHSPAFLQRPIRERLTAELELLRATHPRLERRMEIGLLQDKHHLCANEPPAVAAQLDAVRRMRETPLVLQGEVLSWLPQDDIDDREWSMQCQTQYDREISLLQRVDDISTFHVRNSEPAWLSYSRLKVDIEEAGGRFRHELVGRLVIRMKEDKGLAATSLANLILGILEPPSSQDDRAAFADSWTRAVLEDRQGNSHLNDACRALVRGIQALRLPDETARLTRLSTSLLQMAEERPAIVDWVRDAHRYLPTGLSTEPFNRLAKINPSSALARHTSTE
jgi:hypothetical protein